MYSVLCQVLTARREIRTLCSYPWVGLRKEVRHTRVVACLVV